MTDGTINEHAGEIGSFTTFREAFTALLSKLLVHGRDLPEQNCRELFGVAYRVEMPEVSPELISLAGIPHDWLEREIGERVSGQSLNPGTAWHLWGSVFQSRLRNGKFAYTYAERLQSQLDNVVQLLKHNPTSRRALLTIWDHGKDLHLDSTEVPCTVVSQYSVRNHRLEGLYFTRSNDALRFLVADFWLYWQLQKWLAERCGCPVGSLSHIIGSFHIYNNDLARALALLEQLKGDKHGIDGPKVGA